MHGSVVRLVAGTCALAVLVMLYSLWRQQSKANHALMRITELLEGSSRDEGRPSVNYQVKMNGGVTRDELRAIVREELLAARTPGPLASANNTAVAVKDEPAPDPANQRAYQSARRLVDDALSARVWGEHQASELGTLRRQLTAEQFESLLAQLMPAVNNQQVRVDVAGPLF